MSAWKTSTLGEVASIVGGGTPTRSNPDFYGGTIPWVTPKDMKSWEITEAQITITQSGLDRSATRLVPKNSILIVVRSGVLKHTIPVGLNRLPVAINQDMKALQCRDGIDADFLARFIKAQSPVILQWVRATTADNFPIDKLKKLPVPLPPLAEQRRIAEVLDRAEALRAKRRAALAQLDSLTQSLFVDAFGDPLANPKGIKTTKLGSLCVRITDGTHQPPTWNAEGHPFLFVSNIMSGEITFDTEKFISDETHAELMRRCPVELGDVLYSTVGSYGVPAIVRSDRKFAFQRHIAHLKPDHGLLNSEFLAAMLASPALKRQADRAAKGVAQKTVNLSEIREFIVFQPPMQLQREFARRVTVVEKQKRANGASLAELDALFASLQSRAFKGEL